MADGTGDLSYFCRVRITILHNCLPVTTKSQYVLVLIIWDSFLSLSFISLKSNFGSEVGIV